MADQDPPGAPLRRLDPSEPDQAEELGRLEPLDPEAAAPAAGPADEAAPPRPRDGLALAAALAVLLSLSSIGAIGGLVAVSVRTLEPAPDHAVTSPIETAAAGPPIRVLEAAAGAQEDADPGAEAAPREEAPAQEPVAPPPAPPSPPPALRVRAEADRDERQGGRGDGGGRRRSPRRVEGAWCDAAPGGTCDVVVGGPPAQPTEGDQDRHPGRGRGSDS